MRVAYSSVQKIPFASTHNKQRTSSKIRES